MGEGGSEERKDKKSFKTENPIIDVSRFQVSSFDASIHSILLYTLLFSLSSSSSSIRLRVSLAMDIHTECKTTVL